MEGRRAALVSVINQKKTTALRNWVCLLRRQDTFPLPKWCKKNKPDRAYYIGTGKIAELKELCQKMEVDIVIFNNDISAYNLRT